MMGRLFTSVLTLCYRNISCHPHFQLPLLGARVCLFSDGTEVTEEFFQTLLNNTELVLLAKDQTWSGGGESNTAAEHMTHASGLHQCVSSRVKTQ